MPKITYISMPSFDWVEGLERRIEKLEAHLAVLNGEVFGLRLALNQVTGGSGPVSGRAKAPPAQPTDSIDGLDNPAEIE